MNRLELCSLTVGYSRKKQIWEDFSLTLRGGEIGVLLGENGCGKTTLLKAIQGTLPLRKGSVRINGIDLAGLSVRRRAALVTTMPQEIPAEAGITGLAYLEMGFYPQRGPFAGLTKEDIRKIENMAAPFGITHLLERELARMSVGERQMLSLLRAAVQDTPVLLLDEPASSLDFRHTHLLFSMLKRLAAEGKCILTVLHDPTQALRCGTKLCCLEKGKRLAELSRDADPVEIERVLRQLYPHLRLHTDPVFCWQEEEYETAF